MWAPHVGQIVCNTILSLLRQERYEHSHYSFIYVPPLTLTGLNLKLRKRRTLGGDTPRHPTRVERPGTRNRPSSRRPTRGHTPRLRSGSRRPFMSWKTVVPVRQSQEPTPFSFDLRPTLSHPPRSRNRTQKDNKIRQPIEDLNLIQFFSLQSSCFTQLVRGPRRSTRHLYVCRT